MKIGILMSECWTHPLNLKGNREVVTKAMIDYLTECVEGGVIQLHNLYSTYGLG